jgi:hypothetical protein
MIEISRIRVGRSVTDYLNETYYFENDDNR